MLSPAAFGSRVAPLREKPANAAEAGLLAAAGLCIEPVPLPQASRPVLFVVIDTEEEFDWGAPLSRDNINVQAIRDIGRLHALFSHPRVRPTYVVDYPIASQTDGYRPLKEFYDGGEAAIGAHLHPWVNPPFTETITRRNSFGCRLGFALEREKIRVLRAAIADSFGMTPTVFKAGRYGFGVSTAAALESLKFSVDLSINPRMNFSAEGGPSFDAFDTRPFFFGRKHRLLEIPCSTDYSGVAARFGPALHGAISQQVFRLLRLPGVMARLGVINKGMLSPEGHTLAEMKALTTSLLRRGIRTFSLTMHSPSVAPGCTPYVQTQADLRRLLDRVRAYCDFFFGDLDGVASTPEAFRASLLSRASRALTSARNQQ